MVKGGTCQMRQEYKVPFRCLVYGFCAPSHLSLQTQSEEEMIVIT